MEEFGLKEKTLPEVDNDNETAAEENQSETAGEVTVPVKFNKEMKNLKLEEATILAQKGLKYDSIAKDYEKLKELAADNGKSVPEFLQLLEDNKADDRKKELTEQCGGNEEMAEYILKLEKPSGMELGFEELKEEFPSFHTINDLPKEVVERAKLKGRLLLDEYLRFRLESKKAAQKAENEQIRADASSIGSLKTRSGFVDPEAEEFLKGILR